MNEWSGYQRIENALLVPNTSIEESQALYNEWAEAGTYDELMGGNKLTYDGLKSFNKALKNLYPNPGSVRVLDIGAGTGLTGELLMGGNKLSFDGLKSFNKALKNLYPNLYRSRNNNIVTLFEQLRDMGYKHIDALEPCPGMIKILSEKKIYNKVFIEFIGGDKPITIPDDTFDTIAMCGAFGPGHIPCNAVLEMIRITKPGGYIVNCMREEYMWTVPEYKNRLEPLLEKCETDGLWKKIKYERYPNHFHDKTGLLMIYQVC